MKLTKIGFFSLAATGLCLGQYLYAMPTPGKSVASSTKTELVFSVESDLGFTCVNRWTHVEMEQGSSCGYFELKCNKNEPDFEGPGVIQTDAVDVPFDLQCKVSFPVQIRFKSEAIGVEKEKLMRQPLMSISILGLNEMEMTLVDLVKPTYFCVSDFRNGSQSEEQRDGNAPLDFAVETLIQSQELKIEKGKNFRIRLDAWRPHFPTVEYFEMKMGDQICLVHELASSEPDSDLAMGVQDGSEGELPKRDFLSECYL